jgi:hypothetical protein
MCPPRADRGEESAGQSTRTRPPVNLPAQPSQVRILAPPPDWKPPPACCNSGPEGVLLVRAADDFRPRPGRPQQPDRCHPGRGPDVRHGRSASSCPGGGRVTTVVPAVARSGGDTGPQAAGHGGGPDRSRPSEPGTTQPLRPRSAGSHRSATGQPQVNAPGSETGLRHRSSSQPQVAMQYQDVVDPPWDRREIVVLAWWRGCRQGFHLRRPSV